MIILLWPLVIIFTLILYALILVTLPFSATWASVFLFTLIAFWSRLPGVGIPNPGLFIWVADVIDMLSMIVAINVGGIYGAFLSLFANIVGRACGVFTGWEGNIKDAVVMFFVCLIIPYIHVLTGDILVSMMIFQILRILIHIVMQLFIGLTPKFIGNLIVGGTALFVINILYVKIFGDFFDNLMQAGVAFNWPLFNFASIVIFGSYGVMYFFSDKEDSYNFKAFKKKIKEDFTHLTRTKPGSNDLARPKEGGQKKESVVETIENGCPVCQAEVRGNNKTGFRCAVCKKKYRRRDLFLKRF